MELRVEHKYLVPERLRARLRAVIRPFVQPDSHATPRAVHDGNLGYTVRSIYYDTSRFAHYFANEEGLPVRAKPRIRGYDTQQDDSLAFLEVKRRNGTVGSKARASLPFGTIPELLATGDVGRLIRSTRAHPDAVSDAEQFLHRFRRYALRPVILVVYDREPYVGTIESSLRITFDCGVRSLVYPSLSRLYDDRRLRPSLKGCFVLEVKHDARLGFPIFLRPFLASHGIVRTALSKYFICLTDQNVVRPYTRMPALARAEWRGRASLRARDLDETSEGLFTWTR